MNQVVLLAFIIGVVKEPGLEKLFLITAAVAITSLLVI